MSFWGGSRRISIMIKKIVMSLVLILLTGTTAIAAEFVTFKGTGTAAEPDPLILTAKLTKPKGEGPFPAVVMLHGCGGALSKRDNQWAERLVSWGYAVLQVDSFKPRGIRSVCADRSSNSRFIPKRVRDAYDAKTYLSGLSFIDRGRIVVMGWSHGGWTALHTLSEKGKEPFKAAVAFYPWCDVPMAELNAPLLILMGDADDWSPSDRCVSRKPAEKTELDLILKVYPNAYHDFDAIHVDGYAKGVTKSHRLLYNEEATNDAIVRVKGFLEKHLK
jgi:dienelactone hydrolase